jgi:hypothetical protein
MTDGATRSHCVLDAGTIPARYPRRSMSLHARRQNKQEKDQADFRLHRRIVECGFCAYYLSTRVILDCCRSVSLRNYFL